MDYATTLSDADRYIRNLFRTSTNQGYPYHNLQHTIQVVAHAREIAQYYGLKDPDLWIILVAAWFHDIGHLYGGIEGHEEKGVMILKSFLADKKIPEEIINAAASCIMATRADAHPATLDEMILCDADTYHFGTDNFRQTDSTVRREMEIRTGRRIPDWQSKSLQMLEQHQFYTDYCRQLLGIGVRHNIAWLKSQA